MPLPLEHKNNATVNLISEILDCIMQANMRDDAPMEWGELLFALTLALKMTGQVAFTSHPGQMTQKQHDEFVMNIITEAMQSKVQAIRMESKEEYESYIQGLTKGHH